MTTFRYDDHSSNPNSNPNPNPSTRSGLRKGNENKVTADVTSFIDFLFAVFDIDNNGFVNLVDFGNCLPLFSSGGSHQDMFDFLHRYWRYFLVCVPTHLFIHSAPSHPYFFLVATHSFEHRHAKRDV